jgi:hypothetical protein
LGAGLAAVVAALTLATLATAAVPSSPPAGDLQPPYNTCTFSKGVWTCRAGDTQGYTNIIAERDIPIGAYGDCTDPFGNPGTPYVREYTYQSYTVTPLGKYRADGTLISNDAIVEYTDPYVGPPDRRDLRRAELNQRARRVWWPSSA